MEQTAEQPITGELVELTLRDPDLHVAEVMKPGAETNRARATEHEVAALFERRDLVSVAVLDDDNRLLGRITVDDVVGFLSFLVLASLFLL